MAKKERVEESYTGEFDRNAFFIQVARQILKTGNMPAQQGLPETEALPDTLSMSQRNEKFLHARQVELSQSGVRGSFSGDK